ncbi:RimK/LysX family protein [Sansalvadorimonas sp. 2012CJ34-2]|uniref:RimK/LysX family protein n=1 Tax=Parendozoicomonas callyspongiae TaxID=2942213 RepID=A0ABT0PJP0_9GAMM|nr:RimK/LysX family protein [Sansalvadorimonas sp. 2012CJ34-2]MCL6271602.1 RimK/LysX family protein [Sansalvadorimonas sp. 2012CJ34-2]
MNKTLLIACLFCLIHLPLQADTKTTPFQQKETKILGGVETLGLPSAGMALDARIDTGAELSSLDARNIKDFKKDGKDWVSFELVNRGGGCTKNMELPVERYVRVKRHGAESQCRPVVCLPVVMGSDQRSTPFTLTDRRKFEYPILLGRSFLSGLLVDINKKNLTGKPVLNILTG